MSSSASLSLECEVRLVVATFPKIDVVKLDAAQLLMSNKALQWTKILRGLQFIKTKLPNVGFEEDLIYSVISLSQMVSSLHFYQRNFAYNLFCFWCTIK